MSMQMTECPRCGYHLGPTKTETGHSQSLTTNETAALTRREGEVSTLHAEVRRLETLIEGLNRDKSALLSKINSIQARTRHLPTEVLSSIFKFARPPINFSTRYADLNPRDNTYHVEENAHHALAAVCHSWRQVVLSTPQLWTTISLRVDRRSPIQSITSLLNLYFERAQNFSISIELNFSGEAEAWGPDTAKPTEIHEEYLFLIEPLRTALFVEGADKIQILGLIQPPIEWLPLLNENLTQCTTVMVFHPMEQYSDAVDYDSLDLTTMPCLRRVDWVSHSGLPPIPDTVTTLHLQDIEFLDCYSSLMSYSNLVDFEMTRFSGFEGSMPSDQINEPIVFPQLQHFRWSRFGELTRFIQDFLRHVRFPKLRSLHWTHNREQVDISDSPNQRDPRLDFFSNLPPTLSSLTIYRLSPFNEEAVTAATSFVQDQLNCVPQVSKLHLIQCSEPVINILVDAIGQSSSLSESPQKYLHGQSAQDIDAGPFSGNKVLPNLRELVIGNPSTGPGGWWQIGTVHSQKICNMFEALRVTGENREVFHLVLGSTVDLCNDREILLHLKTVAMTNGFDLEISIDTNM